jgi:hypothetical protein
MPGFRDYAMSFALGGIMGGMSNGFTAKANGGNFWNGNGTNFNGNGYLPGGSQKRETVERSYGKNRLGKEAKVEVGKAQGDILEYRYTNRDVRNFLKDQRIYSAQKGGIDQTQVESMIDDMMKGQFDVNRYAIGVYRDAGVTVVGEGNHRLLASVHYAFRTNDYSYFNALTSGARVTPHLPLDIYHFP